MYIIQVKHDPNMENFVDMAKEEKPAASKQKMKQLVGKYQSEGRVIEIKAEAKMQYKDYFGEDGLGEQQKNINKAKKKTDKLEKNMEEVSESAIEINEVGPVSFAKTIEKESPCKGPICINYNDGECESFDDINDPIVNSKGECQGFKPGGKIYILSEIKRVAKKLDKTPSMSEMDIHAVIDKNEYYRKFDGYKDACKKAGLTPNQVGGGK